MSDTLTAPARHDADADLPLPPDRGAGDRSVSPLHVLVVAGVALLIGLVVFRPWPLDQPVVYRGDVFQHLALTQAADDLGEVTRSPQLGAPGAGVSWSAFPTGMERLQVVVLRALDALSGDVFVALNLYLLLGLVVTAAVTFAVLRWLRIRPRIAGAAAIVIALAPAWSDAVFAGHLFLFAIYPVPLGIYLACWALDRTGRRPWPARGSIALAGVASVVVALSSSYYATFTVLVVGCLGVAAAVRRRDARRLIGPALVVVAIGVTAAASLAPQLLERRHEPTSTAIERTVADARLYGLDPVDLLVERSDHPIGPLAALGGAIDATAQDERVSSVFGLAALAGLVWLAAVSTRRWRRPRDTTDATAVRLAAVGAVGLAFAVSGGLGLVLAELGFTQIRGWSRMTAFVYVAAIAGLALLGQRALDRSSLSRTTATRVVVAVAALAVLDQGLGVPDRALAASSAAADRAVVAQLESRLGPRGRVFELPVVSFPDDPGSERLLAPSLVGSDLRLSGGFFRGGADDWQMSWCRQPTPELVRAVASAGFDALLVQRDHHLVEHADALQSELTALLGAPGGSSPDGTWVWWDLRPERSQLVRDHGRSVVSAAGDLVTRPIGVSYRGTVLYSSAGRAFDGAGSVALRRLDGDVHPLQVQLHVAAAPGATVEVGGRPVDLDAHGDGVARLTVTPRAATTEVPVTVRGGDHVTVADVSVLDRRTFTDPVLVADPAFRPATLGCT